MTNLALAEDIVSLLRNILIVGLLICVAYNGYLIYRNHTAIAQAEPEEKLSDAPLFNSEAFTALAGNRSQVSVQQAPTIVLPNEQAPSAQPVSNPVLVASPPSQENVATVSAESPEQASQDQDSSDTLDAAPSAEAPEDLVVEVGPSRFTTVESPGQKPTAQADAPRTFAESWKAIEAATAEFRLAEALRLIDQLARRSDLSAEQHTQTIRKGDELAETVIHASNKHLALPAHTFLPGSTLKEVADQHTLPLSFLRNINNWQEAEGPTPGDSIKVLQGPISLYVDLPRSGILVSVGDLYGSWLPIDKMDLQIPAESSLELEQEGAATQLLIGDVAVVQTGSDEKQSPNSIGVSPGDWELLSKLAGVSTLVTWSPERTNDNLAEVAVEGEASSEEPPQPTDRTQIVMQPVDALKLEVFTPVGKAIQGEQVRYGLQVSNLSERDSDLVQVVVHFSEGVEPTQVEGQPGRVEVGQAIFDPLTIPAGQNVRLTVVVDAQQPGNHVVRPELLCAQPATRYATEVQLQVAAAESVSAESISAESRATDSRSTESQRQESEGSQAANAMAELPQNPARKTR